MFGSTLLYLEVGKVRLLLSRLQGNKPHSPETSGTFRKLHPEPASGTCLRNLHKHTLEPSGTLWNLHQPEPSETLGTCLCNLHQHTLDSSGTFRNLPPQPTPAHTGTLRNLPPEPTPAHAATLRNLQEPASGNYNSTPEPSGTCHVFLIRKSSGNMPFFQFKSNHSSHTTHLTLLKNTKLKMWGSAPFIFLGEFCPIYAFSTGSLDLDFGKNILVKSDIWKKNVKIFWILIWYLFVF